MTIFLLFIFVSTLINHEVMNFSTENVVIEGTKMLVLWKDSKSKKANKRRFPAEIVKISGLKLYPFVLTKKPLPLISHLFRNIDILCMCVKILLNPSLLVIWYLYTLPFISILVYIYWIESHNFGFNTDLTKS